MKLILNDLSINFPCTSKQTAIEKVSNFFLLLDKCNKFFDSEIIVGEVDISKFEIAKDYFFHNFFNDREVDELAKYKLKSILNRSAPLELPITNCDYYFESNHSKSLLMAANSDKVVVSFQFGVFHNISMIEGHVVSLSESEIIEKPCSLFNLANEDHLLEHEDSFDKLYFDDVKTGTNIWLKRDTLFQNLYLCPDVEKDLKIIQSVDVKQVINKLKILDDHFGNSDSKFDFSRILHCTPDSESTLNKYPNERKRLIRSDEYEIFSYHLRFTGTIPGRIYFKYDEIDDKGIIGYIGKKLPTVSNPTI